MHDKILPSQNTQTYLVGLRLYGALNKKYDLLSALAISRKFRLLLSSVASWPVGQLADST
jgi:hypothetical protein